MNTNLSIQEHFNEQIQWNLPESYDDNKITLLAVDAHTLYTYWDISNDKIQKLISSLGRKVWDNSIPTIKVANLTKNSGFFIRINDFSQNWYIYTQDPGCVFMVEIGRKISEDYFISLASSNQAPLPNTSISFNNNAYFVNYKFNEEYAIDDKGYSCLYNTKRQELTPYMLSKIFKKHTSFDDIYGNYGYSNPLASGNKQQGISSFECFNTDKTNTIENNI